jgi:glycosyltransferase involved in cell wall biosynthesis
MAASAILTIEPVTVGGVPAMVRAAEGLLRRWGHSPTLVYTDAESVPTDGLSSLLRYFGRRPLPRREHRDGMEGVAIPLWPLPQWLGYYAPLVAARRVLMAASVRLLISGSAHTGLPFAVSRQPYIAWIATLYGEEIEARAASGDRWASRLRAGREWPILLRQEALVLERAALVLALSPHTAESIGRQCPAIAPRLRTLVCPIDTGVFRPAELGVTLGPKAKGLGGSCELGDDNLQLLTPNSQLAIRNSQFLIPNSQFLLLTARIRDPRKNVNMLLRAFARARAARPDVSLVITGDEPLPQTRALAHELGLGEAVQFRGAVSQDELVCLCQSAALLTLPSLQEGLGISALEAMACGTPVVATRCGGPEGHILEGHTGWLTPNGDEAAFAEAIVQALAEPARLQAMRANCRKYAEQELSRGVVEAKLLTALREVFPQHFAEAAGGQAGRAD